MKSKNLVDSHPYLNFAVNLGHASFTAFLNLGEAKSKIEHISNAPILPEVREEMHKLYLAKGIHATTAIEGNTLTEDQVRQIIEKEFKAPPSIAYQKQEINNVADACNEIAGKDWEALITEEELRNYNSTVLSNLSMEKYVVPGEYRTYTVTAGKYRAPHAQEVPRLMRGFIEWLNNFDLNAIGEEKKLHLAILKAIYAHLFFVWIHPFGDGNGRVARLIELRVLLGSGVPTPVAHLLSNHYNKTRDMYYRKLGDAQQNSWNFVEYALQGLIDGLAEQIGKIQQQQKIVLWGHLVRVLITGDSPVASRRRTLARELAMRNSPVRKAHIPLMSIDLAGKYAGKTLKTVDRDVKELLELELVKQTAGHIEANWDQVLSLLPSKLLT